MCVIIHKPKGKRLPKKLVMLACRQNPDGFGFTAIHMPNSDKKMISRKGFFAPPEFWGAIKPYAVDKACELVIHCRIRTQGEISVAMSHPFTCGNFVLFHNGFASGLGNKDKLSDTAELAKLISGMEINKAAKLLQAISYSKFALVNRHEVIRIGDWKEYKGLHCSNLNFLPYTTHTTVISPYRYFDDDDDYNEHSNYYNTHHWDKDRACYVKNTPTNDRQIGMGYGSSYKPVDTKIVESANGQKMEVTESTTGKSFRIVH